MPTAEHLDDVVCRLSAAVATLVDDQRLFVDLVEEHAVEEGVTGAGGLGQVDVADLDAAGLIDPTAIALHPAPQPQYGFRRDPIGRASGRESVWKDVKLLVVAVYLNPTAQIIK